mmetsp:Transcript_117019/g.372513  ORF Transcript_117019/g.372513 Transcript_117019/m.372513 type:complete len:225 (-) Transcript_117019:931-1605(-)
MACSMHLKIAADGRKTSTAPLSTPLGGPCRRPQSGAARRGEADPVTALLAKTASTSWSASMWGSMKSSSSYSVMLNKFSLATQSSHTADAESSAGCWMRGHSTNPMPGGNSPSHSGLMSEDPLLTAATKMGVWLPCSRMLWTSTRTAAKLLRPPRNVTMARRIGFLRAICAASGHRSIPRRETWTGACQFSSFAVHAVYCSWRPRKPSLQSTIWTPVKPAVVKI